MMPLAHPGVCVLAQNVFIIRLDLTFLSYAAETLPLYYQCITRCTSISLCALIYFLSSLLSQ
jgi:hypothetical protein